MVGKSTCGSGATGSSGHATRPINSTAAASSDVPIGRLMKAAEMLNAWPPSTVADLRLALLLDDARPGVSCTGRPSPRGPRPPSPLRSRPCRPDRVGHFAGLRTHLVVRPHDVGEEAVLAALHHRRRHRERIRSLAEHHARIRRTGPATACAAALANCALSASCRWRCRSGCSAAPACRCRALRACHGRWPRPAAARAWCSVRG